jgi:hypothetical protein
MVRVTGAGYRAAQSPRTRRRKKLAVARWRVERRYVSSTSRIAAKRTNARYSITYLHL